MTYSPTSSSDDRESSAFERLHPKLRRWVYDRSWNSLHEAQERAIGPILESECDVVISAATAAGKTEAAFLPILSALVTASEKLERQPRDAWTAHDPWAPLPTDPATGIQVLYVSPLKALINDQYDRLDQLCERAEVKVHRWHGDVSGSSKLRLLKDPSGVLLITPESLEALFVNRGTAIRDLFAGLRYVVVDEVHSFIAAPRGAQLQSLMHRIELAIRRQPPRIGLSATLGDMTVAAEFLRPADPEHVELIECGDDGSEIKLQLRGYVSTAPLLAPSEVVALEESGQAVLVEKTVSGDQAAIADHLFRVLRGQDNLVFANARRDVETYADLLSRRSERERLPNEFWPHHGSLSKDLRESVEELLKDSSRNTTAVCTSTLEMGIDIGSVASIAQVGPPPSVAALRQRLGRSGRRDGEASVLRLYVSESPIDERSGVADELRCAVVQTTAMVQLMLDRWLEAPVDPGLNYSTLIQQIMSIVAQHGGAKPIEVFRALCGPGPFGLVDQPRFVRLLRSMVDHDLLTQAADGLLLHGAAGERFVNHYSFYTAFQTAAEWRLVAGGKTLGTIPIDHPLYEGLLLIFAGRRWRVLGIDSEARVVQLERSSGGIPPRFLGGGIAVSDRVREQMLSVYESNDVPDWLNSNARELLNESRTAFRRLGLSQCSVLVDGPDLLLLPWMGDRAVFTATIALLQHGIETSTDGPIIRVHKTRVADLADTVTDLLHAGPPQPEELAAKIQNTEIDKWDWVLDATMAAQAAGERQLDVVGGWTLLARVADSFVESTDRPGTNTGTTASQQSSSLLDQEYCVVDLETTGFSPRLGDRIVEIAAVRMRGDGTVLSEWSTLINPLRDIGATHVHGITPADVTGAPRFEEVVGDALLHLREAVLVAHNLSFDLRFLTAELDRASVDIRTWPALCTLRFSELVEPHASPRKLGDCCERHGIELAMEHHALADARATAELLAAYLRVATTRDHKSLSSIGCNPVVWPNRLPSIPPSGKSRSRS